jgi:DhnA family fructose-bisphosphate aldolase class Ia
MGKKIRAGRIFDQKTNRAVIVPMDHGMPLGTIPGLTAPMETFRKVTEGGADAVLMAPGQARMCKAGFIGKNAPSLILRLDWTNLFRNVLPATTGSEALIARVEDAVRYGADAVIAYFFVGYEKDETETYNLENIASIARECEKLAVPFFVEPMARGKRVKGNEYEPEYVKLHVRMAAEIGADYIKTDYTGDPDSFKEAIRGCPVPVLIAGGPKLETKRETLEMAKGALDAGAAGVIFGRNVFQASDPCAMVKALRLVVHDGGEVEEALKLVERPEKQATRSVPYPYWE